MDQPVKIKVQSENLGKRLDAFLSEILILSRSRVSDLIDQKLVEVNGQIKKSSYRINEGDQIIIRGCNSDLKTEFENDESDPDTKDWQSLVVPKEYPLDIVYEDKYLLVVNKPAGMVVHPGVKTSDKITLVEAVKYHLLSTGGDRDENLVRCGLVHRLDQDTSGLIVFAKDDYTHKELSNQFKNKTNLREYRALLSGYMKESTRDIETYLVRSTFNRMAFRSLSSKEVEEFSPLNQEEPSLEKGDEDKFIVNFKGQKKYRILEDRNGRKARYSCSHFKKICSYDHKLTYVSVRLDTGRTHQIRVHAKDMGTPVLADKLYGSLEKRPSIDPGVDEKLKLVPRQLLHAGLLGIIHPGTGEKICFKSELPQEFQKVLYLLTKLEDN